MMRIEPDGGTLKVLNDLREQITLVENEAIEIESQLRAVVPAHEEYMQDRCRDLLDKYAHALMAVAPDDAKENHIMRGRYDGVRQLFAREATMKSDLNELLEQKAGLMAELEKLEAAQR